MWAHPTHGHMAPSAHRDADTSRLHRACALVAEAFSLARETPDEWLASVCESLTELESPPMSASALVYEPIEDPPHRRVVHVAVAGMIDRRMTKEFLDEAQRGFPNDDLLLHQQRTAGAGVALRRDEIVDNSNWIDAQLRRTRASVGLHDFARALFPFRAADGQRVLLIELNAVDADSPPDDEVVEVFNVVAPHIFKAFYRRFVGPARLRDQMLESLTPAQRSIIPLLAEGYSVSEIAERLGRSPHTIHDRRKAIYKALHINSRFALRDLWKGIRTEPEPVG